MMMRAPIGLWFVVASAYDDADNDLTSPDRVIGGVERTRYGVPRIYTHHDVITQCTAVRQDADTGN